VRPFARAIGLDSLEGLVAGQHVNASQSALTTKFKHHQPLGEFPILSRTIARWKKTPAPRWTGIGTLGKGDAGRFCSVDGG